MKTLIEAILLVFFPNTIKGIIEKAIYLDREEMAIIVKYKGLPIRENNVNQQFLIQKLQGSFLDGKTLIIDLTFKLDHHFES